MAIKLNKAALAAPPANVSVPGGYRRADITPGILHIGAGIKSCDAEMRNKLQAQDWLTTVVELDASGLAALICASERERSKLQQLFGIEDAASVFCEPYRQWVMRDMLAE